MDSSQIEAAATSSFEIEKYKLDRAHELELNKFTHALEMERLKLLTFLNGGAAAAWLTFSKTEGASEDIWAAAALVLPTLVWLVGLIFASVATQAAFQTQRAFTQAYHRRRRSDEWRAMRLVYDDEKVATILPRSEESKDDEPDERAYSRHADEAVKRGIRSARKVITWTFGSVAVFVLGALTAGALTLAARGAIFATLHGGGR